ncbi:hypothetical protein MTR_7g112950 [Medicago truncatula]|uniref:Transmembrane protein n=1 Tax=Medicago truncatula TaxID=3880 RepID=G7KXL8_MEDTR|nr:hypothetical protein MTR_7g112950 [Medicago truncatula]
MTFVFMFDVFLRALWGEKWFKPVKNSVSEPKQLESAKGRECQINYEISRGKLQFEKINYKIVEFRTDIKGSC